MLEIENLAELQVRRKFFINAINRQKNAAAALVRRALNFDPNSDDKTREAIRGKAAKITAKAMSGKGCDIHGLEADIEVILQSIEPLELVRTAVELEMKKITRKLTVWTSWGKSVRGLGELGLSVIIAETGDLANYSNPAKVWKRLGLAPFQKGTLTMAAATWRSKGGLTAEDWTSYGYSPRRRAEIHSCVGDPLFRHQTMASGIYRVIYDKRRAHTATTHADWTKAHSHNDALRIMTKQLLADLWCAWNGRARFVVISKIQVPSQPIAEAAYGEFHELAASLHEQSLVFKDA